MNEIDPMILGHNQFIGVSHFSQDTARKRVEHFSDIERIIDLIKFCLDLGVHGLMLSTHSKSRDILRYIDMNGLSGDLNFYPLIPYAQGYVRKFNEKGILALLSDILKPASISQKINIMLQGGVGFLKKDFIKILRTLIDLELLPFKKFNIKAVFLHNVLTDLGLALEARELFEFFIDYIKENYNAIPAFGTMNFVKFVESFKEWGIKRPLVMTSFNKVGFQMNPSKELCEETLRENDVDVLAMSTLAAGYLKPREAFEYLFSLPKIKSIVVGVSTKEHAAETFGLIKKYQRDIQ